MKKTREWPEAEEYEERYRGEKRDRLIGRVLRLFLLLLLAAVMIFLGFRIFMSSYYPEEARGILPTEGVRRYCLSLPGEEIAAKRQKLRFNYDNTREGYFFAGELVVIPGCSTVQVSMRYNRSTLQKLAKKFEDFDPEAEKPFTYRAVFSVGETEDKKPRTLWADPAGEKHSSYLFYEYDRLSFEGLPLEEIYWIRVEVMRPGDSVPVCYICVYENTEKYHEFTDFTVKKDEVK